MSKMIYIFKVNDPNNAGAIPPTLFEWLGEVKTWLEDEKNVFGTHTFYIPFDSEEELSTFMTRFTLTDPVLKSDLATWKAEHGVSFINEVYRLDLTEIPGVMDN